MRHRLFLPGAGAVETSLAAGTGAFTTFRADRTVTAEVTGDDWFPSDSFAPDSLVFAGTGEENVITLASGTSLQTGLQFELDDADPGEYSPTPEVHAEDPDE